VSESFEGSWDASWHGEVNASFVIVPVKCEATAEGAVPINGEFVVGFECVNQMLGVCFRKTLDTKVIDTQNKGGAFGSMAPEARSERHGFASVWS
jgi:hypothetical protein